MEAVDDSESSQMCNLAVLDSLNEDLIGEIDDSWNGFCLSTEALLKGNGDLSFASDFVKQVQNLCNRGLDSLVIEHFLGSLEETFEKNGASRFWRHFDAYGDLAVLEMNDQDQQDEIQQVLHNALEEISSEKQYQEKCLSLLVHALQTYRENKSDGQISSDAKCNLLFSKYHLTLSSVLVTSLPRHFPDVLHWYFKGRLEELSTIMATGYEDDSALQAEDEMDLDEKSKLSCRTGKMDIDGSHLHGIFLGNNKLVKNIGMLVRDLRNLGFTSMAEDAYASAIFFLLKTKVHELAGDDYRSSVLESIKRWIQAVPLQFLHALLAYLGDSKSNGSPSSGLKSPLASYPSSDYYGTGTPSEGLVRWQLRLEYFAYETLQDLRIAKLFEIIVDYPDRYFLMTSASNKDQLRRMRRKNQEGDLAIMVFFVNDLRELLQDEALNVPGPVDQLLSDYAKRFHEVKTPRKLLWKKNLGTVKLELEFEDRVLQFTVTPLQASIIMQFQDKTSWTSKNLASAVGVPVDVLNRRINFWISKGILAESIEADSSDHKFTLVEALVDSGKTAANVGSCEELLGVDEDGERSVVSVEDQLHKEMTVYEKFITGMLTNFGSMALDRIHNTLKMFCIGDPSYDKSLQQLQSFLSGLVAEEKLELREGMYFLKK
ncbi:anaphase-promoting complex subunit 2 [Olea europaea var. sylvestris]|uniref:anaphase-promoting complex subunit 2 n=1 Tax=Olea europaea var. sylvestris TaxID=158386 RepID=UPI000C1D48C9|nr:anaphase-promoting complex subunit 2 [Olea europaea var. sylvestris]